MRTLYILTKSRDKLKLPFSMQLKGQNIMPVTWELPLWELCIFLQNLQTNQNYLHYFGLTEHTFKYRFYKWNNSFKYESKRNSAELSDFIWGWKKQNVHLKLDWSILEKVKHYSLASKKHVLRLTDKYHIIFSSKSMLKKCNELVIMCRYEKKFCLRNS